MAPHLERGGVRKRDADAKLAVGVGIRALVAEVRDVAFARAGEGLGQRECRRGVIGGAPGTGVDDGLGDAIGDPDKRDDVASVVVQDRLDEPRLAEGEPAEVALRDERARDVVFAYDVEDRVLQLTERRRAVPVAPEPTRRMQEIEVGVVDAEVRAQGHDEARPEQRQVEALPVVRRARAEGAELVAERAHERRLGTDLAEEVLPENELAVPNVRRAEQEDVRAGAPHEARGLGVEEHDVLPARR